MLVPESNSLHGPSLLSHPQTTFMWPFSLLSAQDHQQESKSEESSDPTSYAGATPSLELEQELHYSSIIFRGEKPRESPHSEYAEIRIKWGTEGHMSLSVGTSLPVGRRTHRLILGDLTSPSAVGSWTTACKFPAICLRLCNHRDLGSHPCSFIY